MYDLTENERLGFMNSKASVLEEGPFAIDSGKFKGIKIWGTVLGGRPFPAS